MCCRYVLLQEHTQALLARLGLQLEAGSLPVSRYNIPPGGRIPAVRNRPGTTAREFTSLHWGLVPAWARDASNPTVNARAETLAGKPTFREAFRARRCLIPASGFYEWKAEGRARQPWFFRRRDEQPFALAGLWETWVASDGTVLESCAVITTAPNAVMVPIHHRMPVMLTETQFDRWLDHRIDDPAMLEPLLTPFPAAAMTAFAVAAQVGNVRNDDIGCLAAAAPSPAAGGDAQLGFAF